MAATPAASAGAGLDFNQIESSTESSSRSLMLVLGAALIGGFILNFMPCVLPVIGLKILSFVEQSGDSRGRILSLNLWFTAGLLSVFLLLATLAVAFETSWGDQFTKPWFNVGMAGLVFAMALSFLGVWEIPIPGFVGTSSASRMADKEGAIGAFSKGIVTTLLATPCSGPFLGTVFGFTLRQPPAVVYAIFGCVGLGMASPYLLIGAFPQLVRFLPRPGAWMETFKQIMGFVLLGTVVFVFSFIQDKFQVATFAFLIGIWAACWWIGRTPLTAEFSQKATAWIGGTLLAAAVGFAAFGFVLREGPELPWQPFSRDRLVALTAERKTVMVDFTADWCANCKTNERFALNTRDVQSLVSEYDIVPLVADYTDGSEEISEMLRLLGSRSIPVLAIFPADDPNKPIVLRDLVTQGQVLDALREAGPSQSSLAERTDGAVTTTSVR